MAGTALTNQLLAFSRKQMLQPRLLDLNALITDTAQMLRRLIAEHVQLDTILAPQLGAVRADPSQIEQIIVNLAVNARDAMPAGGRLSIETANVDLADFGGTRVAVRPGPYVMVAVTDTGVLMDEETKRRLFEPFFTTKERGRGTGLGLATVYGVVKQSGGYIWVYSEPGKGATFKVYLPRAEGVPESEPAPTTPVAPAGGAETILVVEDEDAVRFLVRSVLERAGYRVLAAESPRRAELIFSEHADSIAMLLTDVIMPGASGPQLFRQFAARNSALKVLYMSGYTGDTIAQGQLDPEMPFLQKPFTSDGVMRKVREVLD